MKKILLILLAITMCVLLCSCGKTLEGKMISYTGPGNFNCRATFNDGKMHFVSPVTNETFDYKLIGNDTIVLEDSITYTYEIDGASVKFDDEFMGVSSIWFKN